DSMPPSRILLVVATLGGIALMVRSVWGEPIPLEYAIAAFIAYTALATAGVLFPQLEMFGDVLWRGEADQGVVLTFDDGPHPEHTPRILDILEENNVRATFFLVGRKVRLHPEVVKQIVERGHGIGLHGYQHDRLFSWKTPKYVEEDIARTQKAIEEACGQRPTLFRPPIGHVSTRTAAGAKKAGVTLVAWSAKGRDGLKNADPDKVLERLQAGLKPGAILLLHDAAERDDFTPVAIEVLPKLLQAIKAQELPIVPLESFLEEVKAPA
ncbi:MAG: polysaccharide deacetylase family protein, partial [Myxococcales bacterium]|nr:polysaccharide deacetylase family protein [Myxococcales bacterium]